MQSMFMDLGLGAQVRVWTDSNAAKSIASPTRGVEVLVVAGHDQDGKSENETVSRRAELA